MLAFAVTIYTRSLLELLALPVEEGVPVHSFFSFLDMSSTACGGLLVDRNPCFRDITKLLLKERYREILYKKYTTYHSFMWTQNSVLSWCRPQQEELLIGLRDGCRWSCRFGQRLFPSLPAQAKVNNVCRHGAAAPYLQCSLIVKRTVRNSLPSARLALIRCETAGASVFAQKWCR